MKTHRLTIISILGLLCLAAGILYGQPPASSKTPLTVDPSTGNVNPATVNGHALNFSVAPNIGGIPVTTASDTAFGPSWNGVTQAPPSKNVIYDWAHTFDTDDDGKVNVLDLGAGIPKTDASGVLSLAVPGTDYIIPSDSRLTDTRTPTDNTVSTVKLQNDAVTYAKMQNVSATSRVLGRKTSGAGDPEELTMSEVLDFVSSAAQGDILYRNATGWVRLPAGTSGQFLKTQGAGANPVWATSAGVVDGQTIYDSSHVLSANFATRRLYDASGNEILWWNLTNPDDSLGVYTPNIATGAIRSGDDGHIVFNASARSLVGLDGDGNEADVISWNNTDILWLQWPIKPAHYADSAAPNDTYYYSTTSSKLVYKDSGGTVHALY